MRCDVTSDRAKALVTIGGDVDVTASPEFRAVLQKLVAAGARHITVDFADVTFVDSSGLGVLVGAHRRLAALGGSLTVVHAQGRVRAAFELTGLSAVFGMTDGGLPKP